jgi:hypothetical protein
MGKGKEKTESLKIPRCGDARGGEASPGKSSGFLLFKFQKGGGEKDFWEEMVNELNLRR